MEHKTKYGLDETLSEIKEVAQKLVDGITNKKEKPHSKTILLIEEEHLIYLNELRKSGKTNMMAAPVFLRKEFPQLTKEQSYKIFEYWVKTFNKEK